VILSVFINDFESAGSANLSATAGAHVNTRPRWSRWLPENAVLWLKRSALVFFVRSHFEWALAGLHARFLEPHDQRRGVATRLMENEDDADSRSAMARMRSLLEQVDDVVRGTGVEFAIVFMPNFEIFGRPPGSVRFLTELREFAQAHCITFIDPTDAFRSHGRVEDLYLRPWDNAHFSASGHRLVAKGMFEAVHHRIGSLAASSNRRDR